jgi:Lrp/AsnC family transcriptional regulator for asnA, asnC and gidA
VTRSREPLTRDLDATDRAILEELWRDARMSNRQIASRLGVSEGTVRSRIRRMTDQKLIRITAIRNIQGLERPIAAMVGIEVEPQHLREVAEALREMPETGFVGIMMGRHDIYSLVFARDTTELSELLLESIGRLPGVVRTESAQILEYVRFDYRFGRID